MSNKVFYVSNNKVENNLDLDITSDLDRAKYPLPDHKTICTDSLDTILVYYDKKNINQVTPVQSVRVQYREHRLVVPQPALIFCDTEANRDVVLGTGDLIGLQ